MVAELDPFANETVPPSASSRITVIPFDKSKHPVKSDKLLPTALPAKSLS